MKTVLPITIVALFVCAPALALIDAFIQDGADAPDIPFHTAAYTNVRTLQGPIQGNLTLTPTQGVIAVREVVTVEKGSSLTVLPGTTLVFSEYSGIHVRGTLNAQGSPDRPIRFISNELNETNKHWNGIIFEQGSSGSLANTVFHHASPAISCMDGSNATGRENTYLFGNVELYGHCEDSLHTDYARNNQ